MVDESPSCRRQHQRNITLQSHRKVSNQSPKQAAGCLFSARNGSRFFICPVGTHVQIFKISASNISRFEGDFGTLRPLDHTSMLFLT